MTTITKEQVQEILAVVDQGLCNGLGDRVPGQMCAEAAVGYIFGDATEDRPVCVAESLRRLVVCLNDAPWSNNSERARGMRRLTIAQLGTDTEFDEWLFAGCLSEQVTRSILSRMLGTLSTFCEPQQSRLMDAATRCLTTGSAFSTYHITRSLLPVSQASILQEITHTNFITSYVSARCVNRSSIDALILASFAAAYKCAQASLALRQNNPKFAIQCASDIFFYSTAFYEHSGDQLLIESAELIVQILKLVRSPGTKFLFLTEG